MIKLAVIGMGDMGSKYAGWILQDSSLGFEITAATRIKPKHLSKIERFIPKDFKFYQSDDELFRAFDNKEFEADAVLVVTPHIAHEHPVIEAFKRNLHVLCDKPAGVYLRQGRQMLESCPKGSQYGFIFHQRTYPINRKLKEIVESKIYGNVKRVSYIMSDWYRTETYYKTDPWRAKYKTDGGGTLLNQCPHSIDLLCYLFGMPKKIMGFCHEGKYHSIEVEDEATAYIEWPNNVTGIFVASTGELPGVNRLEISFERAVVTSSGSSITIKENSEKEIFYRNQDVQYLKTPESKISVMDFESDNEKSYKEVLKAFSNAIEGKGSVIATGEEALMSLYFSNAAYLSSSNSSPVNFFPIGSKEELNFEKEFEVWLENKGK